MRDKEKLEKVHPQGSGALYFSFTVAPYCATRYQVEPKGHFFPSLSERCCMFHFWNSSTRIAERSNFDGNIDRR
jgi:hypothetical protein